MTREHDYAVRVVWTGARGVGTETYRSYSRTCEIAADGKPPIAGSADRTFHGDADRWNPEEMLLAALAQCHMLSYLHVATRHGVVVVDYRDDPVAAMAEDSHGGGAFTEAVLRPVVVVRDAAMVALAATLHAEASRKCFIAGSVAFPVRHEPTTEVADRG